MRKYKRPQTNLQRLQSSLDQNLMSQRQNFHSNLHLWNSTLYTLLWLWMEPHSSLTKAVQSQIMPWQMRNLKKRIQAANKSFGALHKRLWSRMMPTLQQRWVYNAVVIPSDLYGTEALTFYERDMKQLTAVHIGHLRRLLGILWQDMIPNTQVIQITENESTEAKFAALPTLMVQTCAQNSKQPHAPSSDVLTAVCRAWGINEGKGCAIKTHRCVAWKGAILTLACERI